jgi:hypothetical protein
MTNKELENRKELIIKILKIRKSQMPKLKNINVAYDKRYDGEWYVIIDFEYNNKKYQYRETASDEWIMDEKGKVID